MTDLFDLPTAEDIYQAYPRKVAKPNALRAIKKALKTISANELLRLTTEYAAARRDGSGNCIPFTPHPATWFNGERFNDDPKEWRTGQGGGSAGAKHRTTGEANRGRTYRPRETNQVRGGEEFLP